MSSLSALLLTFAFIAPADDDVEAKPASFHLKEIKLGMKGRRNPDELERDEATRRVVTAIDHLTMDFELYDDKEKKAVVRGVAKVLSVWTGEQDDAIHLAAAAGLSEMGDGGAAAIRSTRSVSHIQRNVAVRCILIEALGKHRDPKDVDYFLKLLDDDDNHVVTSAATALAEYFEADQNLRRKIARGVLKPYVKAHKMNERKDGEDPFWYQRLIGIEVAMNFALDRMTAANLQSAPEWERWMAENGNKDW